MRIDEVLTVLNEGRPDIIGVSTEIGQRRGAAYIRLVSEDAAERWAAVSTPGDRWFSIEVDSGFSLDYFEEEAPDDEVRRLVECFIKLAIDYIVRLPSPVKQGMFGLPVIKLFGPEGEALLRRSLLGGLSSIIGRNSP